MSARRAYLNARFNYLLSLEAKLPSYPAEVRAILIEKVRK